MIGYMKRNKLIDCVTFFDNNLMFDVRYNILVNQIDYFVICESRFDHKGDEKGKKFIFKKEFDPNKIKYLYLITPKGVSQKAKLTIMFMKRKMREYDELKKELKDLKDKN